MMFARCRDIVSRVVDRDNVLEICTTRINALGHRV